jgi:hypothetical protein
MQCTMLLVTTETSIYKPEQFLDCSHSRFGGSVPYFLNPLFLKNKVDYFMLRFLYPRGKSTLLNGEEG